MIEEGYLSEEKAREMPPERIDVMWEGFDAKQKNTQWIEREGVRQGNRVALQDDRQAFSQEQQARAAKFSDDARRKVADIRAKAQTAADAKHKIEYDLKVKKEAADVHRREYAMLRAAVDKSSASADPGAVRAAWEKYQDSRDAYVAMVDASEDPGTASGEPAPSPVAPEVDPTSYPSWLLDTEEAKKAWDSASDEEKAKQIAKRGK